MEFYKVLRMLVKLWAYGAGDKPEAHHDGGGEEGLQLPAAEGQPDRQRHRVHRRAPARQAEWMGHHGLPQVYYCIIYFWAGWYQFSVSKN